MKNEINLHPTQIEGIDFIVNAINNDASIVALIGAGGVGKSEILSRIVEAKINKSVYVSASTNKAVSRLSNDINGVKTLHSSVAKPSYKPIYHDLKNFYSRLSLLTPKDKMEKARTELVKKYPFIKTSKEFIQSNHLNLLNYNDHKDLFHSLKISMFDPILFDRYIVKEKVPNSVLFIDEASMVPNESKYYNNSLITIGTDTASQVYSNIVIIGDNSQLPPIDGTSSFDGIESYELTKNFRSQKDLLRAIQYARDGLDFMDYKTNPDENVKVVLKISDEWYKRTYKKSNVVHIAYTNKTRKSIIKKVRGNNTEAPVDGEPVLLRGTTRNFISKGEVGIYQKSKNQVKFENGSLPMRNNYFDEYNENKYSIFQYGYAMTAHMSQGSSFDHVIVHLYDIPFFIDKETKRKWIYTAVSRARKSITIII